MKRNKRADSTEELLDVIRGDDDKQLNYGSGVGKSAKKRKKKSSGKGASFGASGFGTRLGLRRAFAVGVDITDESINAVSLVRGETRKRINSLARVPLGPDIQLGSPAFVQLLRNAVNKSCAGRGDCQIWALLRTSEVDINAIRIPRVPQSKIATTVYWQQQKERKFDDREYLMDYRVQGQVREEGVPRWEVLACLAKREDVDVIKDSFARAGIALAGVTTIASAFRAVYRTNWFPSDSGLTASLHVDSNFSCITIYDADKILFSRTIRFGLNSMAEELMEGYNSAGPKRSMDLETAGMVLRARLLKIPMSRKEVGAELKAVQVYDFISGSLERVARQAERTLDYYWQNNKRRCDQLHLSGEIFGNDDVSQSVAVQLGLDMELFDPLATAGASVPAFGAASERLVFNEALALALCEEGQTLNLAHTYKERERERRIRLLGDLVAVAAMVLALLFTVFYIGGKEWTKAKKMETAELSAELAGAPMVDEGLLSLAFQKVGAENLKRKNMGARYETLALINELNALVPDDVRVVAVHMDMGKPWKEEKEKGGGDEERPRGTVIIDGLVMGEPTRFDTILTRLVISLKSSALFKDVEVQESGIQEFNPEGEVLHFVLESELG